uniref:Uncharacterized protein n=1 Tax=Oryza sativa subsp. japonica TaxID=39947 RepID=Q6ZAK5_ORYSJ|nr:hypothetical protein [Oryza sativa Japonica Group]
MVDTAPGGLKYHQPVTQISTTGAASQSEKDDDHELLHHYSAQRFPETSMRTLSLLHYGSARCHHASSEPSMVRLLVVGQERRSEADWGRNGTMDLGEKRRKRVRRMPPPNTKRGNLPIGAMDLRAFMVLRMWQVPSFTSSDIRLSVD